MEKIKAVEGYLSGADSQKGIARELGISKASLQQWIRNYRSIGSEAFTMQGNIKYSAALKRMAVEDYLSGLGSQNDICLKYGIRSSSRLQKWIMQYNSHEELKTSGKGGTLFMTKGRKTTYDERLAIIMYCIENAGNYTKTAEKYHVSYQQVYQWMKKYEAKGAEGLVDKRGKRKPESEMSDTDRLRAENKLLRAEKRKAETEIEFLKKVDEIERRRY